MSYIIFFPSPKPSKAVVLQKSIERIQDMQEDVQNKKEQLARLKKELVAMEIMKGNYGQMAKDHEMRQTLARAASRGSQNQMDAGAAGGASALGAVGGASALGAVGGAMGGASALGAVGGAARGASALGAVGGASALGAVGGAMGGASALGAVGGASASGAAAMDQEGSADFSPGDVKFEVFSRLMDKMFQSFNDQVSMDNFSNMSKGVLTWVEEAGQPQNLQRVVLRDFLI